MKVKSVVYYKIKKVSVNVLIHLFLISVSVTCLLPLIWMVVPACWPEPLQADSRAARAGSSGPSRHATEPDCLPPMAVLACGSSLINQRQLLVKARW